MLQSIFMLGAEQDKELLTYFRRLRALRNQFPVLSWRNREVVHLNVQRGTYAYLRTSADSEVLVALNTSPHPQTINVPISSGRGLDSEIPLTLANLLKGNPVTVLTDSVSVSLPAQSGAFIKL